MSHTEIEDDPRWPKMTSMIHDDQGRCTVQISSTKDAFLHLTDRSHRSLPLNIWMTASGGHSRRSCAALSLEIHRNPTKTPANWHRKFRLKHWDFDIDLVVSNEPGCAVLESPSPDAKQWSNWATALINFLCCWRFALLWVLILEIPQPQRHDG